MKNSIFKAGYLEACRKYCPSLEIGDGIRAQAVMKDGTLVHDFCSRELPACSTFAMHRHLPLPPPSRSAK